MLKAIAFDLDGTLIDTAPDMGAAMNSVLAMLHGSPLPDPIVPQLIGAGITAFVERALAYSLSAARLSPTLQAGAEASFRKLYAQRYYERSAVYPHVAETLATLAAAGLELCCITNKETSFALRLLEATKLRQYFPRIYCADLAEDRKPSPNLLLAACSRAGINSNEFLYVGDSRSDIIAARAAGCRVVAVTYGYTPVPDLQALQPDALIGDFADLCALADVATARAAVQPER